MPSAAKEFISNDCLFHTESHEEIDIFIQSLTLSFQFSGVRANNEQWKSTRELNYLQKKKILYQIPQVK